MKRYLSKVLYVLSGKRQHLIFLLVAFIFASLLEALGIGLIGPFLAVVADPRIVTQYPVWLAISAPLGLTTDSEIIVSLGVLVIGIFCFKAIAYSLCKYYIYRFSYTQKSQLESRLVHTYLNIPYIFHLNHNSAGLIKNIMVESHQFATNCLIPLLEIVANLIVMVFVMILLAYTDLSLLVVALGILLPTILLFTRLSRRMRVWGQQRSESMEDMIRSINHGLGGIKETKVVGCEAFFEKELSIHAQRYAHAAIFADTFHMLPRVSIETVLVVFLLIFVIGSQLIGGRNLEDLTAVMGVFAVASIRLLPAASQMLNAFGRMRESSYALNMLYFDLKEIDNYGFTNRWGQYHLDEAKQPLRLPTQFQHTVTLERVTYAYPEATSPSIENFSLSIQKGESIALVGKSGAGKTTLVDLLLGLLTPESGDIKVDGVSIYQNLRGWQDLLGYIPQSIFLVDDTIEQNIAFGVPPERIDRDKLAAALQAAQLDELITTLPEGLQTPVGERGVRLSGGQRQRIGIARALYHGREILVLDEATSALDSETERLVSEAINALAGNKTLIIIAHRLSTIERCDRIFRLENGQLKQSGTYNEVIAAVH
jgi:ATP-binding cassette, subfamily B, bacterial PglK